MEIKVFVFALAFLCLTRNVQAQTSKVNFITTDDGTKLFVKKSGKGPICIFIHGGPGAWSKSFEDLKGNNLETKLSMVYYDQRGCGRSDNSANDNYSLDRMINDIELIRQHFNADKVYLMAHSFGGILAVNYALKFSGHVKGLILANSTLNLRYSLENQISYINSLLKTSFKSADSSNGALMSSFLDAKNVLSEKKMNYIMLSDNEHNVELVDQIDSGNPSDYAFAKHVFKINDYWKDYTEISKRIQLPVLIITGKKDHSIGENHFLSFHFPDKQIKKINGGHLLYYEHNLEFINSVFGFIKQHNH